MKSTKTIMMMAIAAIGLAFSSCGGSAIDQSLKDMMLAGDTTQASFEKLCEVIKSNPDEYGDLLTEGEVNIDALSARIEAVGSKLRPAAHWNVKAYTLSKLSLSLYLERSGSMTPYDSRSGAGELKKAANDMINHFAGDATILIVNDSIYPYAGSTSDFLKEKDIYAATAKVGNPSFTDFSLIFTSILGKQKPGEVSVLITDLIYSPKDANVSADKIFNEENSLATSVFKQFPGKSLMVYKLMGDYKGTYYPYKESNSFAYNGKRPFYVLVMADADLLDRIAADPAYADFFRLNGAEACTRFNQAKRDVNYTVVPGWETDKGRFRLKRGGDDYGHSLEQCENDRATGKIQFSIAADFSALGKSDQFLCDANNYAVSGAGNYSVTIEPIGSQRDNGRYKSYLNGKTHVITVTGEINQSQEDVTISMDNLFPRWIDESTSDSDLSPHADDFAVTTFGLGYFLHGVYDAFGAKKSEPFTEIKVHLAK